MNINRQRLLEICTKRLTKMMTRRISCHDNRTWQEIVDMDFVFYLTREIVLLDPTKDCRIVGDRSDWDDLPYNKSLFHSNEGCFYYANSGHRRMPSADANLKKLDI